MRNEPVLTIGTATSFVGAVITLLVAFGLHLSDEQVKAVMGFILVAFPIAAAVLARRHVTPVGKHVAS